jgi:hypothetical protein
MVNKSKILIALFAHVLCQTDTAAPEEPLIQAVQEGEDLDLDIEETE